MIKEYYITYYSAPNDEPYPTIDCCNIRMRAALGKNFGEALSKTNILAKLEDEYVTGIISVVEDVWYDRLPPEFDMQQESMKGTAVSSGGCACPSQIVLRQTEGPVGKELYTEHACKDCAKKSYRLLVDGKYSIPESQMTDSQKDTLSKFKEDA